MIFCPKGFYTREYDTCKVERDYVPDEDQPMFLAIFIFFFHSLDDAISVTKS
jgi:hypothetical protein